MQSFSLLGGARLWKREQDKAGQTYPFSGATVDPTRSAILPLEELGDLVAMKAMYINWIKIVNSVIALKIEFYIISKDKV